MIDSPSLFCICFQRKLCQTNMLSCNRVGHGKRRVIIILYKRIEATGVHLCLYDDFTSRQILRIDSDDSDMLAVNRGMEQVQWASKKNEVTAGLAVTDENRCCPCTGTQIIWCQETVGGFIMLAYKVITNIIEQIHCIFPFGQIREIRLGNIFPCDKITALDDAVEVANLLNKAGYKFNLNIIGTGEMENTLKNLIKEKNLMNLLNQQLYVIQMVNQ